jgi:hypothetical protein
MEQIVKHAQTGDSTVDLVNYWGNVVGTISAVIEDVNSNDLAMLNFLKDHLPHTLTEMSTAKSANLSEGNPELCNNYGSI